MLLPFVSIAWAIVAWLLTFGLHSHMLWLEYWTTASWSQGRPADSQLGVCSLLDAELVQETLDELSRLMPKSDPKQTLLRNPSWVTKVERGPKRLGPHPDSWPCVKFRSKVIYMCSAWINNFATSDASQHALVLTVVSVGWHSIHGLVHTLPSWNMVLARSNWHMVLMTGQRFDL